MSDKEYQFYNNYQPAPNVSKSLRSPKEDIGYSAPHRDMLSILESEECWRPEDAIDSYEILEKLVEFDENKRERTKTPPKSAKTIRISMDELREEKKLVRKVKKPGRYEEDSNKKERLFLQVVASSIPNKLSSLTGIPIDSKRESDAEDEKSKKTVKYWKEPDEEISHPILRQPSLYIDKLVFRVETLLYRNDLIKIAVFLYVLGTLVYFIRPETQFLLYASAGLFIVGHLLAYFGEPLTQ